MKNLLNFLSIGIFIISFFSACTEGQNLLVEKTSSGEQGLLLSEEEITSISYDDTSEIPQEEAINLATNFIELGSDTRASSELHITVKNKEYLTEKDGNDIATRSVNLPTDSIPIYEFLISSNDNNYYALVSADRRSPGVLAIFDRFPTDNDTKIADVLNHPNMKAAVTLSKMQIIKDVETIKQIRENFRESTIEKICHELNLSKDEYSFDKVKKILNLNDNITTRNSEGIEMPQEQIVLKKGPMAKILWEQYTPYNGACPEGTILINLGDFSFLQEGHVPAGCVTIACMNIEACLERTPIGDIPMDWSYYKTEQTLFEAIEGQSGGTPTILLERAQNAIRYIYNELASTPVYKYYNGTAYVGATESYIGQYYIKENFNYKNDQKFDPDTVLSSLNEYKPVYLEGRIYGTATDDPTQYVTEGHAFVIDGYIICQKASTTSQSQPETRANIVKYYDMYWHLSLGWGETAGYFKLDSDATCTPEFYDKYGRYNLIKLEDMHIISHISQK